LDLVACASEESGVGLWKVADGSLIHRLKSGSSKIFRLVLSTDGSLIVGQDSGGEVLRFWSISDGRSLKTLVRPKDSALTAFTYSPDGTTLLGGTWDGNLVWLNTKSWYVARTADAHDEQVAAVAYSRSGRQAISASPDGTVRLWNDKDGKLVATLFATREEWIAATPDHYFGSSLEGAHEAAFSFDDPLEGFSCQQFASRFNSPQTVHERLERLEGAGETPKLVRPPRVRIVDSRQNSTGDVPMCVITVQAQSGAGLEKVRVYSNGRCMSGHCERSLQHDTDTEVELEVPLQAGSNTVTVVAYDRHGLSSNPATVEVHSGSTGEKPDLYVLSIGVNRYARAGRFQQLMFAARDARSVAEAFDGQSGKLYGHVYKLVLTDGQVTPANVGAALEKLSSVGPNDIAIVFLAGHGIKDPDTGKYYYLTSNATMADPASAGIPGHDFLERLHAVRGRVLLLLDTCHSGHLTTEVAVPNDKLVQQMVDSGRSGVLVFSAAKGLQESLEGPDFGGGHGVFAWAILEGLGPRSDMADVNENGTVEWTELVEFVRRFVRTQKLPQTPWVARSELFGDFPLVQTRASSED